MTGEIPASSLPVVITLDGADDIFLLKSDGSTGEWIPFSNLMTAIETAMTSIAGYITLDSVHKRIGINEVAPVAHLSISGIPDSGESYLRVTPVTAGAPVFNFGMAAAANAFGTVPDYVQAFGWNILPGGRIDGTKPAMGEAFEYLFTPDIATRVFERHLVFVNLVGYGYRPMSWQFNWDTDRIWGSVECNQFDFLGPLRTSFLLQITTTNVLLGDGINLDFNTVTGSKIGSVGGAAGQKFAFWGKNPIVQPVLATGAGHNADDIITVLQNLGLCRQS